MWVVWVMWHALRSERGPCSCPRCSAALVLFQDELIGMFTRAGNNIRTST
jgi:hypothetical protein